MRERALRSVLLIKAVEEADREGTLLPAADRAAATRDAARGRSEGSAAAGAQGPAGPLSAEAQRLLATRAQLLHARLAARVPVVDSVLTLAGGPWWLGALLLGAESRRRLLALRAGRQPPHQRARLPAPRPGAVEPARVPLRARPPDAIARAPHDPALARRPAPRADGAGPRPAPDREVRRLQRAARRRARPLRGRVARGGLARSRGARRPAPASLGRRGRARPDRGPVPARPRARLRGGLGEHLPHRAASTRPAARRVRPGVAPDRHPDPRRRAAGRDTLARWARAPATRRHGSTCWPPPPSCSSSCRGSRWSSGPPSSCGAARSASRCLPRSRPTSAASSARRRAWSAEASWRSCPTPTSPRRPHPRRCGA